ncbi:MAG: hypothetical protein PW734_01645 [Verrucomicrobium sp.]|nr:hypothetical protein [Verrucomicrobium sp.]
MPTFPSTPSLSPPDWDGLAARGPMWVDRRSLLEAAFGGPIPGIAPDPEEPPLRLFFARTKFEAAENGLRAMAEAFGPHLKPGEEWDAAARAAQVWNWGRDAHRISYDPHFETDDASFVIPLMGHEGIHVCQFEDALTDLLIAPRSAALTSIGENPFWGHGPALERLIQDRETFAQLAARHHILQRLQMEETQNLAVPRLPYLADTHLYLLLGVELEARVGELVCGMSHGGAWPRLPESREELEQVFQVVRLPSDPKSLSHWHADFSRKRFHNWMDPAAGVARNAAHDLQEASRAFPAGAARGAFFETVLTEAYASFAERCGDYGIRAKLGLDPGTPHGRKAGRQLRYEVVAPDDRRWTEAQWARNAARAEGGALPGLLRLAAESQNDRAFPILLDACRRHPAFDPAALRDPLLTEAAPLLSPRNRALLNAAAAPKLPAHLPFRRDAGKEKPGLGIPSRVLENR